MSVSRQRHFVLLLLLKYKCWDEFLIKLIINRVIIKQILFRINSSVVGTVQNLLFTAVLCLVSSL